MAGGGRVYGGEAREGGGGTVSAQASKAPWFPFFTSSNTHLHSHKCTHNEFICT